MELIRKMVSEAVASLLKEGFRLEPAMVPQAIRSWVESTIGARITKYELEQRGEMEISMPFYEVDREEYQLFRLVDGGAVPVDGVSFYRGGNESDGVPVTGIKVGGTAVIPSGHVLVQTSRYLKTATLYSASDAMKMLMPAPSDQERLSDMELLALFQSRFLVPKYRHKFAPEVYQRLVDLGLMASNKSISNKGRNTLEMPEMVDRLGSRHSSDKLDHLIGKHSWLREGITPERRAEAVEFVKTLKRYVADKYGMKKLSVQLGKSVMEDPYIMVTGRGDDRIIPAQLRRDCIMLVYGPAEADRPSIGNISEMYVTMHWSQWVKLIA